MANSIESDVDNLMNLMTLLNVFPRGLYVEEAVAVAKRELALECDYRHEAAAQARYAAALRAAPPPLRDAFVVPAVVPQLCGDRVLASEWVHGVPVDRVQDMPQDVRDRVGTALLRLTLQVRLLLWAWTRTTKHYCAGRGGWRSTHGWEGLLAGGRSTVLCERLLCVHIVCIDQSESRAAAHDQLRNAARRV